MSDYQVDLMLDPKDSPQPAWYDPPEHAFGRCSRCADNGGVPSEPCDMHTQAPQLHDLASMALDYLRFSRTEDGITMEEFQIRWGFIPDKDEVYARLRRELDP